MGKLVGLGAGFVIGFFSILYYLNPEDTIIKAFFKMFEVLEEYTPPEAEDIMKNVTTAAQVIILISWIVGLFILKKDPLGFLTGLLFGLILGFYVSSVF
ncbi:hypothetical protein [Geoglobus acetivorans]|uniref:Uncharacterized protein n=1 Tax=Geoglobus acetivorans TaxID=565033 RepID=A0ABZ3H210_GEOAI|nr:hypothetical protein [Geoglobus acetivorans]